MKSLVIAPTLHSSNWKVFAETLAFIILGGFHRWNLGEIHWISLVKSTRFQGEIPHPAFIKLKSFCWNTCFYNFGWISQVISGWNLPDFTSEIHQISGWNLVDFMKSLVIAPTLHSSNWKVFAETLAFIILGGFHRWNLGEIHWISLVKSTRFQGEIPHPAFIKLKSFYWNTCFYNFGWISQVISGWNLLDFRVKSTRFQGWSPLDFMGEIKGEIRRISKDQLPGMVSPMFFISVTSKNTWKLFLLRILTLKAISPTN